MHRYSIIPLGGYLPYVRSQVSWRCSWVSRGLNWALDINRIKIPITAIIQVLRCFACRSSGSFCSTMLALENILLGRLFRYSAPFLHGACPSAIQEFQAAQNVALKVCLGMPKSASGPGTGGSKSISAVISEVSLSVYLRHVTQYNIIALPISSNGNRLQDSVLSHNCVGC